MIVLATTFVFMVLLGAVSLTYQLFRLVVIDAKSRGLKHPNFWGIFSLIGNNSSGGLLLYLIGRNNYPSNMTDSSRKEFDSRKRRVGLALSFIAIGTIGLLYIVLFGNLM